MRFCGAGVGWQGRGDGEQVGMCEAQGLECVWRWSSSRLEQRGRGCREHTSYARGWEERVAVGCCLRMMEYSRKCWATGMVGWDYWAAIRGHWYRAT